MLSAWEVRAAAAASLEREPEEEEVEGGGKERKGEHRWVHRLLSSFFFPLSFPFPELYFAFALSRSENDVLQRLWSLAL